MTTMLVILQRKIKGRPKPLRRKRLTLQRRRPRENHHQRLKRREKQILLGKRLSEKKQEKATSGDEVDLGDAESIPENEDPIPEQTTTTAAEENDIEAELNSPATTAAPGQNPQGGKNGRYRKTEAERKANIAAKKLARKLTNGRKSEDERKANKALKKSAKNKKP
ncbi:unnamed protein product [Owenia fusiformis]|uniref:Uncharacterized protein n=1 Tax=Owenia fusiformis TaxID=6347 RepID=A0A8S4NFT4_OWEFU|nr:unnamed protein product [Owenia fusiformis]